MIISYVPYVIATTRGTIVPKKSTWIIWSVLDSLLLLAMLQKGAWNGSIVAATLGAIVISMATLYKGRSAWDAFDTACSIGAALGAIAWLTSNEPNWGIILFLLSITIAAFPVIRNAWRNPGAEKKGWPSWFLRGTACAIVLVNVRHWTIATAAQPIVFAVIMFAMVALLVRKQPEA